MPHHLAHELVAMRNRIQNLLNPNELRAIHWGTLTTAAEPALKRGWTGDELARWAIAELGEQTTNPGASIVATLRHLADTNPPRDTTPTPPAASHVLAEIHAHHQPANDPHTCAQRIRRHKAQPSDGQTHPTTPESAQ